MGSIYSKGICLSYNPFSVEEEAGLLLLNAIVWLERIAG